MSGKEEIAADLEQNLVYLGLLNKAHEIYSEVGDRAVVSYIRSSYKLLSKVYHPDLNPTGSRKAQVTQQVLNRLKDAVANMTDGDLIDVVKRGVVEEVVTRNRILIAEDEYGIQKTINRMLTMEGYEIRISEDGVKGLADYREFKPRLVISDILMPEMDGLELVAEIRKLNPMIKVIYMSGFFDLTALQPRIDADVQTYGYRTLEKPFKPSTVLNLVSEYLAEGEADDAGLWTLA